MTVAAGIDGPVAAFSTMRGMGYVIISATGNTMMLSHGHLGLMYRTVGWDVAPGHVSAADAARLAVAVEEEAEHAEVREIAEAFAAAKWEAEEDGASPEEVRSYHIRDVPASTDAPTMYAFAELAARGPFEVRIPPYP
jgi:hypothetical protein